MPWHQQGTVARHVNAVCQHAGGAGGQPPCLVVLPQPQRAVEIPLGEAAGTAARRVLQAGLRRFHLEGDSRAVELAGAGLRHTLLSQQRLYLPTGLPARHERSAQGLDGLRRAQPRRQLPPRVRPAGQVERPPRIHHVRRRRLGLLSLDQWQKSRLQRQQPQRRRVRRHQVRQAGQEPRGRRSLSL